MCVLLFLSYCFSNPKGNGVPSRQEVAAVMSFRVTSIVTVENIISGEIADLSSVKGAKMTKGCNYGVPWNST